MSFSLINIGFGNMAAAARVMAIISPESAPVKRMIQDSRDKGRINRCNLWKKNTCCFNYGQRSDYFISCTARNDFAQTYE